MKKFKDLLKHPLLSGSTILIVGSMGANVINLGYHFLMGNILNPINYGILLSLYSILYILSIVPLSSSVSIVKFISKAKTKEEKSMVYVGIKRLIFRVSLISSLIVILCSPFIAKFLNINDLISTILTAGVLFFSLIMLVNQASLQGVLKFNGVVLPNLVLSIVKLILGVVLIFLGLSIKGAMIAVVAGSALAYFLSEKMAKGFFINTSKEKFTIKPFLKYSWPVLIQALAFTSFFTTDVILVKHFFTAYEAGLYAALSTLGKIVYFAASPVASAMFPYISGKHAKGEKYIKILLASLTLTFVISFGIVCVYTVMPSLVVKILYSKYLGAIPFLPWMGLFIAFYTVAYLLVNFFLSIDKLKIVFLPFVLSILQILSIWQFHSSLLEVIQISLIEMILLCFILFAYLGYNLAVFKNGQKEK